MAPVGSEAVATSKQKKRQQARRAQHRSQHRAEVEHHRAEAKHHPLPKVGTPEDDSYRLDHSRKDLVNFGLSPVRKGPVNWLIVVAIVALLLAGAVGLIIATATP